MIKHTQALPNCIQLHKRYQISWEIFGPQITVQLAGQVGAYNHRFHAALLSNGNFENFVFSDEDEYMAFGLSGSETSSRMEGADVVVTYLDGTRGYAIDYNITAKAPVRKCKWHDDKHKAGVINLLSRE